MAEIYYLRSGPGRTTDGLEYERVTSVVPKPWRWCVDKLGINIKDWCSRADGELPTLGHSPPTAIAGISSARFVVCKVDSLEARKTGWRSGYYLLQLTPSEVSKVLSDDDSTASAR
jgi:hypothetical protein